MDDEPDNIFNTIIDRIIYAQTQSVKINPLKSVVTYGGQKWSSLKLASTKNNIKLLKKLIKWCSENNVDVSDVMKELKQEHYKYTLLYYPIDEFEELSYNFKLTPEDDEMVNYLKTKYKNSPKNSTKLMRLLYPRLSVIEGIKSILPENFSQYGIAGIVGDYLEDELGEREENERQIFEDYEKLVDKSKIPKSNNSRSTTKYTFDKYPDKYPVSQTNISQTSISEGIRRERTGSQRNQSELQISERGQSGRTQSESKSFRPQNVNVENLSEEELSDFTVVQLKEICRNKGWSGYSALRKAELIKFVMNGGVKTKK